MSESPSVHLSRHPLLLHRLGPLRNRSTPPPVFRRLVRELAQLLFWEATRDLQLHKYMVETPRAESAAQQLSQRIGLVPILRAGLGMADAIVELIPEAEVWHLGLYRDHKTLKPITYYNKLSGQPRLDVCYVVDPMLATGGSAAEALNLLKRWGITDLRFIAILAAPEGVRVLQETHPTVPIFLGALDSHLDERSYIVPGLGDAGDRQFGTLTD
jgi:uracil phosphoribosyltransferase